MFHETRTAVTVGKHRLFEARERAILSAGHEHSVAKVTSGEGV